MIIGDKLKVLREKSGLTLEEAGLKIGATKQTLYKYENGIVKNIPSDKVEHIARLYNTTPSFIMGWEEKGNLSDQEIVFAQKYSRAKQSDKIAINALIEAIEKLLKMNN